MAVKALLHYALEIPDQTVGEKFYTGFGLVDEPGRDGAVRLRPALLKRETVLLYGGPKKRLHHVAFGAPGAEFEATRESLRRAGVSQVDPPRGGSPPPRAARLEGPGLSPRLVRGRRRRRDRDGHAARSRRRHSRGLGAWPPRHRLQLLLLRARPVGLVGGVLPRPRPHPGD